ncbi:MAG: glycosyltransferase family 4 protein, partial [Deltaproteobacteria bacterium]|nr:glycosyltransferase family 4 protein [Deltaproteobacteria bacterium]
MNPGKAGQRMTRSLSFAYTFPFPAHGGYDLRVVNLARHMVGKIDQRLLCRTLSPTSPDAIEASRKVFTEIHALPLPRPNLLRKFGKGIAFLPGPYPLAAAGFYFRPVARRLEELLSGGSLDLVIMEGSWLCAYWPLIARCGARKVLDLHNLESETAARQVRAPESMLEGLVRRLDTGRMARAERRMIREADLVLVPSERERRALKDDDAQLNVVVVPNGVDCRALRPLPPTNGREILFVGAFTYSPNVDAVIHFVDNVFPLLRRQLPDVTFRLVGRSPDPDVARLGERDGVEVTGEVEDVEPFYRRSAICVAPLRAGGGTRLKILEAMAFGRPVVSTQ